MSNFESLTTTLLSVLIDSDRVSDFNDEQSDLAMSSDLGQLGSKEKVISVLKFL
ncbi:MAG: hypothetical protein WCA39_01445 [Nitrososphaeraceae archaeon]